MEKIEEVKEIMKTYKDNIKKIENKYSKKLKDLEFDVRRAENEIDRTKEHLSDLDTKYMDTIEISKTIDFYKEAISLGEEQRTKAIEKKDKFLEEKEKKEKEDKLGIEKKTIEGLTKSKKELVEELKTVEKEMSEVLEEKDKLYEQIPVGEEAKKLEKKLKDIVKRYKYLNEKSKDIKSAIKYCDDNLKFFKEKNKQNTQAQQAQPQQQSVQSQQAQGQQQNTQTQQARTQQQNTQGQQSQPQQQNTQGQQLQPQQQNTQGQQQSTQSQQAQPQQQNTQSQQSRPQQQNTQGQQAQGQQQNTQAQQAQVQQQNTQGQQAQGQQQNTQGQQSRPQQQSTQSQQAQAQQQQVQDKITITLMVDSNKIKISGQEDLFYKEEAKKIKELKKKYNIKGRFITRRQMKGINGAIISALEKVDNENADFVCWYLLSKAYEKTNPQLAAQYIEKIKESVDINYELSRFGNRKINKIAKKEMEMGLATVQYNNSKKGIIRNFIGKIFGGNRNTLEGEETRKLGGDIQTFKDVNKEFKGRCEVSEEVKEAIGYAIPEKYKRDSEYRHNEMMEAIKEQMEVEEEIGK